MILHNRDYIEEGSLSGIQNVLRYKKVKNEEWWKWEIEWTRLYYLSRYVLSQCPRDVQFNKSRRGVDHFGKTYERLQSP